MVPIVTGTIGLLVACVIILLMRKDRLHVNYGIGWVIVATAFALLGFAPSIIDQIAIYFGVSYPPVLALTLGVAVLVIKILLMDIERSRVELRNQRLIQRMAILEADLKKLQTQTVENTKQENLENP